MVRIYALLQEAHLIHGGNQRLLFRPIAAPGGTPTSTGGSFLLSFAGGSAQPLLPIGQEFTLDIEPVATATPAASPGAAPAAAETPPAAGS